MTKKLTFWFPVPTAHISGVSLQQFHHELSHLHRHHSCPVFTIDSALALTYKDAKAHVKPIILRFPTVWEPWLIPPPVENIRLKYNH
jgi:hypothetical protein